MPYVIRQKSAEAYWALRKGTWIITRNKAEAERYSDSEKDIAERVASGKRPECIVERVKD